MLGYSESELLSLSVRDIHPADELDNALASFNAMARGDVSVIEAIPVLRKGGAVIYADIRASAIVYDGRNCLMGFFRDVTDAGRPNRPEPSLSPFSKQRPTMLDLPLQRINTSCTSTGPGGSWLGSGRMRT